MGRQSFGDRMLAFDWLEASPSVDFSLEAEEKALDGLKLGGQLRVFGGEWRADLMK